jgi:A/G-specific adenine glycosylase
MHNDVWQNLFEFYVVENESSTLWTEQLIQAFLQEQLGIKKATISFISGVMHQQLTHQKISGQFIKVKLSTMPLGLKNYTWLASKELKTLAFPKFINQFLESKNVQGSLF